MTEKQQALLWLDSFMKNKEPLVLMPKQIIRLMYSVLKNEEEIVRCKDCKNRPDNHQMELDGELYRYCELHRRWTTDKWFCADGKKLT